MFTLKELIELKENLDNGKISFDQASEIYWDNYGDGKKSWHTKDWKERRKKFIKNECEICSSKKTLTLQHLSHPKKYNEYVREVTSKYNNLYKESNDSVERQEFIDHVKENFDYIPAPLCPKCKSRYPNERTRKKPRYLCKECRLEFEEPAYKSIEELIKILYLNKDSTEARSKCFISKDEYKNMQSMNKIMYWLLREKAKNKYRDNIKKESFQLYLNENIKYLSFEDTITTCKKCAFNFDVNKVELCPKCKKNYKGIHYQTCFYCLPEDIRKAASRTIEFEKSMQSMHK